MAITADVGKMYRAIELTADDKDLHHFVWRLKDYRMTRVTFGVSASSLAANMSVRQNALDLAHEFLLAAKVVEDCFYVNDCLTGAVTVERAILLYHQLLDLFNHCGFLLQKWNSSDSAVLKSIDTVLQDSLVVLNISGSEEYTKPLGWNGTPHWITFT